MSSTRTTTRTGLLVLAATAFLIPILAACGTTAKPTASPTTTAAATDSASPSAPATTSAASASAAGATASRTPAANVAACTSSTAKGRITTTNFTAATPTATLAVTNTGKSACRLSGWPGVKMSNGAGDDYHLPITQVNKPTAPVTVTLAPGAVANAGLKWVACDKTSDDCPVSGGFEITLPGDSTDLNVTQVGFPAPEQLNLGARSVQVGTVQPSGVNVLGW